MQQILYVLPALMCPLGMGAMMWLMMRGKSQPQADQNGTPAKEQELAQLRAEIAALRDTQQTSTSEANIPTVSGG